MSLFITESVDTFLILYFSKNQEKKNLVKKKMSEEVIKPYSTRKMFIVGNGNEEKCTFDFSLISFDEYKQFFGGLPNFIYKKCRHIVFCNDFYYEYKQDGRHSKRREKLIQESIMYQHPAYLKYLVKIIKQVMPRTKVLETIEFSNIKISRKLLASISHALATSQTLKNIAFRDVQVGDKGLSELLGSISPYQIETITLKNAGITSNATYMIGEFINKKPYSQQVERVVKSIDIDQESYPPEHIEIIKEMIQKMNDSDNDWDDGKQWASRLRPQTDVYDTVAKTDGEEKVAARDIQLKSESDEEEEEEEKHEKDIHIVPPADDGSKHSSSSEHKSKEEEEEEEEKKEKSSESDHSDKEDEPKEEEKEEEKQEEERKVVEEEEKHEEAKNEEEEEKKEEHHEEEEKKESSSSSSSSEKKEEEEKKESSDDIPQNSADFKVTESEIPGTHTYETEIIEEIEEKYSLVTATSSESDSAQKDAEEIVPTQEDVVYITNQDENTSSHTHSSNAEKGSEDELKSESGSHHSEDDKSSKESQSEHSDKSSSSQKSNSSEKEGDVLQVAESDIIEHSEKEEKKDNQSDVVEEIHEYTYTSSSDKEDEKPEEKKEEEQPENVQQPEDEGEVAASDDGSSSSSDEKEAPKEGDVVEEQMIKEPGLDGSSTPYLMTTGAPTEFDMTTVGDTTTTTTTHDESD